MLGTKYDLFEDLSKDYKIQITKIARKYAKKMGNVPLIYCSCAHSINVKKTIKIIVARIFHLIPKIKSLHNELNDPLRENVSGYQLVISQDKICTVYGYLRLNVREFEWNNKMPIFDIGNIVLIYYGNMETSKIKYDEEKKKKKKKKQTKRNQSRKDKNMKK